MQKLGAGPLMPKNFRVPDRRHISKESNRIFTEDFKTVLADLV
jgi:hypothetical protein